MADDFSFLTDSDDDRAVEDLLSQAMDLSVLEQVAAINCSSFSSSDNLPSHLESRFRRLKSLPSAATAAAGSRFPPSKSQSLRSPFSSESKNLDATEPEPEPESKSFSSIEIPTEEFDRKSDAKKGVKTVKSESPSGSSDEAPNSERNKQNQFQKKGLKPKSLTLSSKSPSDSWTLSSPESPSPPRKVGCLWCSPKKESRKRGKENHQLGLDWGKDDEILSDLRTFSTKEQQKIMKKAIKEEEKINREAEKIVKWAKQASSRMMNVSGLDDELSDFDSINYNHDK